MAKHRAKSKSRSTPGGANGLVSGKAGTSNRMSIPQSMVIRMGASDIGPSVSQLAVDFREVVQPHTAARLKERKSNRLRDYTTMAGPLGVTHFFLFSRSEKGNVHLRFALHPRGPTMQFRVEDYTLAKDIQHAQRHSRAGWTEAFATPPLLVQHGMASSEEYLADKPKEKQLESLAQTMFNSMFPVISPTTTKLEKIKRILLLKRERAEDGTFVLHMRHFAITQRRTGTSKKIRRLDPHEQRKREKRGAALPNLGQLEDAADYMLNPDEAGYTSASETELDTDNEVEVVQTTTRKVLSKKEMERIRNGEVKESDQKTRNNVEKRAVKLVELGPRMKLRLVKVEEGLGEGRVMWNEFVTKSKTEEKELDTKWDEKRKLREQRRQEQKENVERKKALKSQTRSNTGQNGDVRESDDESLDTDEVEDILDNEEDEVSDEDEEMIDDE